MTSAAAQPSVLSGAHASSCGDPCAPGPRPEPAQRIGDRERGEERAHAPRSDRDVERGGGVGRRLDQPLDRPDRRDRHREAIDDRRRPVADRNEPPGRPPRREHAAAKRIDGDQHARRLERGVDDALHARIGEVEGVERARQHAETERAAARRRSRISRRRRAPGAAGSARPRPDPGTQSGARASRAARRPAQARSRSPPCPLLASVSRSPTAPSQLPIRLRITSASTGASRQTAAQSRGSRTLDERANVRCANNWRRAALMRVLRSSASSSMARAARRLASSRSCLCFSFSRSLAATSVVGRGLARFGRELLEALRRRRKAGRQVGDRPLKRDRERVALARSSADPRRRGPCP